MNMAEIKARAKQMGVGVGGRKADVIRRIQVAEGNVPCFGTKDTCDQTDCCWRADCLSSAGRALS